MILFSDAIILTETPPLRAGWARAGTRAEVPISGNRDRHVLFGAIAIRRGMQRLLAPVCPYCRGPDAAPTQKLTESH